MAKTPSSVPKDPWYQNMYPATAWRRWQSETASGMKRYDVAQYLATFVPVVSAGYLWHIADVANTVKSEPQQFALASVASGFVLAALLGKRKKASLEKVKQKDYGTGLQEAYSQWRDSAVMLQGALAMTYRYVEAYQAGEPREAGEGPIAQYLHVIALLVKEIFYDCDSHIIVSIAVPVPGHPILRTAKFHMESPGRHPGRQIPLDGSRGAAKAFTSGERDYIDNTSAASVQKKFKGRSYRSFMSWPVKSGTSDGGVVAVISVDSPAVCGFDKPGQQTRRDQVYWMAQPALTGIAICLQDSKTFERYRTNTQTGGGTP